MGVLGNVASMAWKGAKTAGSVAETGLSIGVGTPLIVGGMIGGGTRRMFESAIDGFGSDLYLTMLHGMTSSSTEMEVARSGYEKTSQRELPHFSTPQQMGVNSMQYGG